MERTKVKAVLRVASGNFELWLSFVYGGYNGAMVVYLTEIMPLEVRTAGFSLAYSLATTVGGFTPAIAALAPSHE